MKRMYIAGGFLCVIFLMFLLMNNEYTVTDFPRKEGPIVAYGDSLVEGYGVNEGEAFSYVLSERIGEEIINLGESGNTTVDGLTRIRELESYEPRLVIILLGGNDSIKKLPPEQTFDNLSTLIETLHAKNTAVLLVGITGGFNYAKTYEKEFEKLAKEQGVAYVPNILKGLIGKREFMYDTIHPNKEGHIKMANKIEPELQKLLEHM